MGITNPKIGQVVSADLVDGRKVDGVVASLYYFARGPRSGKVEVTLALFAPLSFGKRDAFALRVLTSTDAATSRLSEPSKEYDPKEVAFLLGDVNREFADRSDFRHFRAGQIGR
jgi:hypothetical protein